MSIFKHKKRLGQNFLLNKDILEKICLLQNIFNEEVIEIGPGKCSLTEYIIKNKPAKLTLIEKDKTLEIFLAKFIKNKKNINLIIDDALNIEINKLSTKKVLLIANLPYNIATTLIFKWVRYINSFKALILMVQKEVAMRLSANVNSKHYSRLSVLIQLFANIEIKLEVKPENFFPQPKVYSSVIEIIPKENIKINYEKLDKTLRMSFCHRRKTLKNNLSKFDPNIEKKIIDCGLNPKLRPQEISPKQYVQLSESLF